MSPAYDWRQLATQYRPTDEAGMRVAARHLAATGLTPRDIATILHITELAVSALFETTTHTEQFS